MAHYTVGIDEVGRGSLAGPVTVAAVAVPQGLGFRVEGLGKLRDSKKLTPKQREAWTAYLRAHPKIIFAISRAYPRTIDRINIARAANRAALRALAKLSKSFRLNPKSSRIYLDGGLYLKNSRFQMANNKAAKTMIRGDEKVNAIKLASIVAKVHRDNYMRKLAKKFPHYGFDIHKGYGTKMHRRTLKRHGSSPVHRLTFVRRPPTM